MTPGLLKKHKPKKLISFFIIREVRMIPIYISKFNVGEANDNGNDNIAMGMKLEDALNNCKVRFTNEDISDDISRWELEFITPTPPPCQPAPNTSSK